MILYLDTSAILKRYFQESFSEDVSAKWKQSEMIVTSSVTYAETMATIYRKQKEADLDKKEIKKIIQAFQMDWSGFIRVEVTDDLNEYIDKVLQKHPLRGFDAIHRNRVRLYLLSLLLRHKRPAPYYREKNQVYRFKPG